MTFPCKEELIELELLAAKQKRIYEDAADEGLQNFKDFDKVKELLEEIRSVFGGKSYKWETGSSFSVFLPIEMDEGLYSGISLSVSKNTDLSRNKTFMCIQESRELLSKEDALSRFNCKIFKKNF